MKKFGLFAVVMFALVLFAGSVFADDFVTINKVEVNNQIASELSPIRLERGEEVVVAIFYTGNPYGRCEFGNDNPCDDVRVEVEIQGYEYGDVRDVTMEPFEVEPGVQDRKVLRLLLPPDMPASDDLDLIVEIKDDDGLVMVRYPLRIQEPRHGLNIYDVILNPATNVVAGQPLFVTARVENLGDNVESSIKVTASIPALGIQVSEYIDKLLTLEDEVDDWDRDADDAATSNDLLLMIPDSASAGDYEVLVEVEYNRGRSVEQETHVIHVEGASEVVSPGQVSSTSTVVNVDAQAQRVEEGQGAVYKFSVANLGQTAGSYTFSVMGVDAWGTARVDPSSLIVQPDSTADAFVYVAPSEDVEGIKTFSVRVMSGANVIADENLSLEVVEGSGAGVKTVFTWIFVILLIILVILVIVVLVRKYSGEDEDQGIEGQTYY